MIQGNPVQMLKDNFDTESVLNSVEGSNDNELVEPISEKINWEEFQSEANGKEANHVLELLNKYEDVFAKDPKNPGCTDVVKHNIQLTNGAKPIRLRPYRYSKTEKEFVEMEIQQLLKNGLIKESSSEWASPVVVVKKSDGSFRFCVDYRKLNAVTEKDVFPLPRIDDTLDSLQGAKYFTTLDAASGYWQIPMSTRVQHLTAFITHEGLYEWKVMPFGLCNAPATYQRFMATLFRDFVGKFVFIYIDDLIICSKSLIEHLKHLELILKRASQAQLKFKLSKCNFIRKRVKFLGHIASSNGIGPDPSKISCIENMKEPKNCKELQSFLGLTGYYRRFVKDYSLVAWPLTQLLSENKKWNWTNECENAFMDLKKKLITAPVLAYPNFEMMFQVHTDASDYALGAVLSQCYKEGERVISYASCTLKTHQRNYSTTERECLALVWACKQFRPYLIGKKFDAITDHQCLVWLNKFKDVDTKIGRWAMFLQEYNFNVIHRAGKKHQNADALSRLLAINAVEEDNENNEYNRIRELQEKDAEIQKLKTKMKEQANYFGKSRIGSFVLIHDTVWRMRNADQFQLYVPSVMIREVLLQCHDDLTAGHLGIKRTLTKVRDRFYWPAMKNDVRRWIKSCVECNTNKSPSTKAAGLLLPIPVSQPFDTVAVDIIERLPITLDGNQHIVVFTDTFTKWVEAFAVPNIEANTISQLLVEEVFCRYGAPNKLLSDRGKAFLANLTLEVCKLLGIKKVNTSAYHPQTDGMVERFNRTLCQMLSMYTSHHQRDWDQFIPFALLAYRSSVHSATKETPFLLTYGREARLPIDRVLNITASKEQGTHEYKKKLLMNLQELKETVRERIDHHQLKYKEAYDSKHQQVIYKIGDLVWIKDPAIETGQSKKFSHLWKGPMKIIQVLTPVTYKVQSTVPESKYSDTIHIARIKPYFTPTDQKQEMSKGTSLLNKVKEEEEDYIIKKIIDKKWNQGEDLKWRWYYKIRWHGYKPKDDSWVAEEDVSAKELLDEFNASDKAKRVELVQSRRSTRNSKQTH